MDKDGKRYSIRLKWKWTIIMMSLNVFKYASTSHSVWLSLLLLVVMMRQAHAPYTTDQMFSVCESRTHTFSFFSNMTEAIINRLAEVGANQVNIKTI